MNFEVVEKLIAGSFYLYFSSRGTASRAKKQTKKTKNRRGREALRVKVGRQSETKEEHL